MQGILQYGYRESLTQCQSLFRLILNITYQANFFASALAQVEYIL